MRGWGWRGALAFVVSGATWGCESPTSISVVVTSDQPCAALKGVRIQAGAPDALPSAETLTTACTEDAGTTRVGTIVIVPRDVKDAEVAIRVIGGLDTPAEACNEESSFAGCVIARRTVRFVPEKEIELPVMLRGACKGAFCNEAATCVRGTCQSANVRDPTRCAGTTCDEDGFGMKADPLPTSPPPPPPPPEDAGTTILPDGGVVCGPGEKLCSEVCVSAADSNFGCTRGGCAPCAGADKTEFACSVDVCVPIRCKSQYKSCNGACLDRDVAHGCGATTCTPCESANGIASCSDAGACELACAPGYKLCAGRCVSIDDPTYGCTPTGCGNSNCPAASPTTTIICQGGACIIGACTSGTKQCGQKCVTTDTANGCQQASRCSACGSSEVCAGSPTVCTCVPEALATTCAGKACGPATNNCGQAVTCPNTCGAPNTCGGGGSGANGCGCTPTANCTTVPCYVYTPDGCGNQLYCAFGSGCIGRGG